MGSRKRAQHLRNSRPGFDKGLLRFDLEPEALESFRLFVRQNRLSEQGLPSVFMNGVGEWWPGELGGSDLIAGGRSSYEVATLRNSWGPSSQKWAVGISTNGTVFVWY